MWPDRVLNPRPLALELDALTTALRGPAHKWVKRDYWRSNLSELTSKTDCFSKQERLYIHMGTRTEDNHTPKVSAHIFSPVHINVIQTQYN